MVCGAGAGAGAGTSGTVGAPVPPSGTLITPPAEPFGLFGSTVTPDRIQWPPDFTAVPVPSTTRVVVGARIWLWPGPPRTTPEPPATVTLLLLPMLVNTEVSWAGWPPEKVRSPWAA